jgi:hypothetical protein
VDEGLLVRIDGYTRRERQLERAAVLAMGGE